MKKLSILFSIICLTYACKAPQTASKTDKSVKAPSNVEHEVLISTAMGDMVVKLYNSTPQHRDNFLKLVNEKFYDSLLFHRVISGFMIQGGDPQSKNAAPGVMLGMGDVGYTIPAEFVDTLFHKKGALCAARTSNPQKASSGCQFYIVQGRVMTNDQVQMLEAQRGITLNAKQKEAYTTIGGTPQLDRDYTVYGEVIKGLDVLDKIAAVKTAPGDRPLEDVRMKMTLLK